MSVIVLSVEDLLSCCRFLFCVVSFASLCICHTISYGPPEIIVTGLFLSNQPLRIFVLMRPINIDVHFSPFFFQIRHTISPNRNFLFKV